MTSRQVIELLAAIAIAGAGVWLYRGRSPDGYGSQSAVLLFVVAVLLAIHGLGLLEYRPSPGELGR